MKLLVIHPEDPTTDFLKEVYSGVPNTTVLKGLESRRTIVDHIDSHDKVLIMGHGTDWGLLVSSSKSHRVLGVKFLDALRRNEHKLHLVWCNAYDFCLKYGIEPPLVTGMIISEYQEALDYCIPVSGKDIDNANKALASYTKNFLLHEKYSNFTGLAPSSNVMSFNASNIHTY